MCSTVLAIARQYSLVKTKNFVGSFARCLSRKSVAMFAVACVMPQSAVALSEWTWHRSADGLHPTGHEQAVVWLMNRARANPSAEGAWLATSAHRDVANGRNYFNVDIDLLRSEFDQIPPMPPAAFDYRLYDAARSHAVDLISRDAQDHNGQLDRVTNTGVGWYQYRGSVYSYADTALHAHAAFNIDWGAGPGNMQTGRGHRVGLMATDANYSNVGVAIVNELDSSTDVGQRVVVVNYTSLDSSYPQHFNNFVVGTVWHDKNGNGRYDATEGIPGVVVTPDSGGYYAVTSAGGGYAFPVAGNRTITVQFSGAGVKTMQSTIKIAASSVLLDYETDGTATDTPVVNVSGTQYTLPLNFGTPDSRRFGWRFGASRNRTETRYKFSGNDKNVLLRAVGYDINRGNEVDVFINDRYIGRLAVTGTRRIGGGNRFIIKKGLLQQADNIIRFVQSTPGQTWGIKDVLVNQLRN